jgi:hypothetical protein
METPWTIIPPTSVLRCGTADVCSTSPFNDYTGQPHPPLVIRCGHFDRLPLQQAAARARFFSNIGLRGTFKSHM